MADNTIKIGGELESMATGKIVAAASAIKDKSRNKTQEAINGDVEAAIAEQSAQFEALSEETTAAVESASESARKSKQYLADLQKAITELPDGQAVSAQVAINEVDIAGLKHEVDKTPSSNDNSDADLDISDENGNVLAEFKEGHVKTKNFDSKKTPSQSDNNNDCDFQIADENGNVLAEFKEGHVKTQKFDSSKIQNVQNNNVVYVKSFGAKGDGVTDDTVALENAVAAAYTKKVPLVFENGTYLIRRPLTLKSNMEIYGEGNATVKKKAASTTTLAEKLLENGTVLKVASVSGFAVGDALTISYNASRAAASRHCSVGVITAINSNNKTITFKSAYHDIKVGAIRDHEIGCFVTNSCAIFRSWGMLYECKNVYIHNLTLDGNRVNGEFGDWHNGCIHIDACDGASMYGITYNKPAERLICRDLVIINSPFDAISDQGNGKGLFENIYVSNVAMHGIHFGTTYNIANIYGCYIEKTGRNKAYLSSGKGGAGVFWCSQAQNILVRGNVFVDCDKGCSDYEYGTGGQNSIIAENVFIRCGMAVIDFSLSEQGTNFKGKILFSNNLIEQMSGVLANCRNNDYLIFTGNIVRDITNDVSVLFTFNNVENVILSNNIAPDVENVYTGTVSNIINNNNSWNI